MIWHLTGWSHVPGDEAYIEADTPEAAKAVLAAHLEDRFQGDFDIPVDTWTAWTVEEATRPLCLVNLKS